MLCDFSGGDGTRDTVWIVGDSHAQQWETAIFDIARSNHWKVKWSYRGGCPVVDASFGGFNGALPSSADAEKCKTWSRTTFASVAADKPKKVFISEYWEREKIDDGTRRPQIDQYVDGLARDWKRWADLGIGVYPIVEPPANAAVRSVDCLTMNATKPQNCAVDRSLALAKDPMTLAARKVNSSMIHIMDFTRFFCDEKSCYSAVGGLPVYYDTNHLNDDYVRHLTPYFIQTMR